MIAKGKPDRRAAAAGPARRRSSSPTAASLPDDRSRSICLMRVARSATPTHRLDTYVWNLLDVITFPNGCHIAEVEVDPETGAVR